MITAAKRRVLVMLAGCPTGATEYALAQHGIKRRLLDQLVANGHARVTTDRVRRGISLDVARFHITAAGRELAAPPVAKHRANRT